MSEHSLIQILFAPVPLCLIKTLNSRLQFTLCRDQLARRYCGRRNQRKPPEPKVGQETERPRGNWWAQTGHLSATSCQGPFTRICQPRPFPRPSAGLLPTLPGLSLLPRPSSNNPINAAQASLSQWPQQNTSCTLDCYNFF